MELGHVWQRAGPTHAKPTQMRNMQFSFQGGRRNPHRKNPQPKTCPLRAAVCGQLRAISPLRSSGWLRQSHSAGADSRIWALTNASSDPPKSRDTYRPTAPGRLDAVFNFMGAVWRLHYDLRAAVRTTRISWLECCTDRRQSRLRATAAAIRSSR